MVSCSVSGMVDSTLYPMCIISLYSLYTKNYDVNETSRQFAHYSETVLTVVTVPQLLWVAVLPVVAVLLCRSEHIVTTQVRYQPMVPRWRILLEVRMCRWTEAGRLSSSSSVSTL